MACSKSLGLLAVMTRPFISHLCNLGVHLHTASKAGMWFVQGFCHHHLPAVSSLRIQGKRKLFHHPRCFLLLWSLSCLQQLSHGPLHVLSTHSCWDHMEHVARGPGHDCLTLKMRPTDRVTGASIALICHHRQPCGKSGMKELHYLLFVIMSLCDVSSGQSI